MFTTLPGHRHRAVQDVARGREWARSRIVRALILLLLFAAVGACAPFSGRAAPVQHNTPPPGLAFTVSLPSPTFVQGALIPLSMQLENVSSRPILVNRRFVINDEHAANGFREVFVRIHGPDGYQPPFGLDVRIGLPQPADFVTLPPTGTTAATSDLASRFRLDRPGTYRLTAVYEQDGRGPTARIKLRSNTLAFTLT